MLETRVPDATTVVLVRDAEAGLELFMAERSSGADFQGGAYVFPGGRVEESDAELAGRCAPMSGRDLERLAAEGMSEAAAYGNWVAAIREVFEEVGVLLAYQDGKILDFSDAATAERFRAHRESAARFAAIVEQENLTLATDRLRYFSRFVTPPYAPKRFDTRFLIADAPEDQLPSHDAFELVSGEWLTAERAIAAYHAKQRQIVPPTLQNLFEIAEAKSTGELLKRCDDRVIAPVCPSSVRIDGVFTLIYPGDLDYMPCLEPGFVSLDTRPAEQPILRFTMEPDGRWAVASGVPRNDDREGAQRRASEIKGGTMPTVEERLHRIEAITEIKELTARYCYHVARNEGDAVTDLFTEDGVLDGSSAGMGRIEGRDALTEFYRTAVTGAEESLPYIQNHIIQVDGDDATGTCALEARFSRGGRSITAAGHYEDTYRRVDGRWRFAERKLFFNHVVPLSHGWAEARG